MLNVPFWFFFFVCGTLDMVPFVRLKFYRSCYDAHSRLHSLTQGIFLPQFLSRWNFGSVLLCVNCVVVLFIFLLYKFMFWGDNSLVRMRLLARSLHCLVLCLKNFIDIGDCSIQTHKSFRNWFEEIKKAKTTELKTFL